MRRIIFSLLVVFSINSYSEEIDLSPAENLEFDTMIEIVEKENKIGVCIIDYVKKQSRTYAKPTQGNLYDLLRNFDKIMTKIYGKKTTDNDVPHEEKVEELAKIQCEAYYTIGVLK